MLTVPNRNGCLKTLSSAILGPSVRALRALVKGITACSDGQPNYLALESRITIAFDGLEKALELRPDLILLDLWLPRISIWDVMQHLKADERTKHIPVLVITGHALVQPREC